MNIVVPHHTTPEKAIALVDQSSNDLLDMGSKSIVLSNQQRTWTGQKMNFSLTAKVGFISVPLSGSVLVDDSSVAVNCELPALARNFIGEDKIRVRVEQNCAAFSTDELNSVPPVKADSRETLPVLASASDT